MIDKTGISTGKEVRTLLEQLENGLILNYKRYFDDKDKPISDVDFKQWQQEKMSRFSAFQKTNKSIVHSHIGPLNKSIMTDLQDSYNFGLTYVEKQIEKATKKGAELKKITTITTFAENRRVQKQLKEIQQNLNKSFNNALRDMDKQFMSTVTRVKHFKSVAPTINSAVDLASKTLLFGGVTSGFTKDNKRTNLVTKLTTDTQEFSQEMMFIGEGEKSSEVGNHYVYITIHASSCPLCTPWQNRVLIDDVYQNGKPDGKHPLLSTAIKAGLFHYNCRHNRLTFILGVDKIPNVPEYVPNIETKSGKRPLVGKQHSIYNSEQQQRYLERQIRKWKRVELGSVSDVEQKKARLKVRQWQSRRNHLVKSTDGLYRSQYWREKPGYKLNKDARWQDLRYNKNLV